MDIANHHVASRMYNRCHLIPTNNIKKNQCLRLFQFFEHDFRMDYLLLLAITNTVQNPESVHNVSIFPF